MIDGLICYFLVGALVVLLDSRSVAQECILTSAEQLLLFARITLSWPTYLIEDWLLWKDRHAE